jgi:glycosyltransferase involved in cell wall biosynthesis
MSSRRSSEPRAVDGLDATHGERAKGAEPGDGSQPVAVVITTLMSHTGTTGLQTHVHQVARFLALGGRPVTVVTPTSHGAVLAVPVFAARFAVGALNRAAGLVWYRASHRWFLTRALRRELARNHDVVIYAQCPVSARAALDARVSPSQRVVMAVHFDGSQADEWADKGVIARHGRIAREIRELEQTTVPELDGIVYVSESARRSIIATLPATERIPSAVVPNFTAAAPVGSPLAEPADLVTVGGLEIHKNHTYLLDVLAAANRLGHRYTLDVIGDGPTRRLLARRRSELGLDGQVHLLGRIPSARGALEGHRAYVHAAIREALPYALIEALAAGLPVVAGCTGGIPEILDDGVEGRIWPLDDADAAARVLIDLLEDEPRRLVAATAAAARFRSRFDAAVVGPTLERMLVQGPTSSPDGPPDSTARESA